MDIRRAKEAKHELALVLPVGPMGMYRWAVYFLTSWGVSCEHVTTFNMDEWSDRDGNTLPPDDPAAFQRAMERALFNPLSKAGLGVPKSQRNFATSENLPLYADKIAALRKRGAKMTLVYGVGRACHIAFWEPHFAEEFNTIENWKAQTHRVAAKLHPLTIEQNAFTSFKSRFTMVPARANTIGPGIFLNADYAIGGCDGVTSRGMQWQGVPFWMTLRYEPDIWVASSFMPTLPGKLFYHKDLAGPLAADCN
jgi:glucosamine-6-phosphate deaminase